MAALGLRGVVLVAELPADLLGEGCRHGGGEHASWLEDAEELVVGGDVVRDVLQDFAGDDLVEGVVRVRQAGAVALHLGVHQLTVEEAVVDQHGGGVLDRFELGHRHVATDDMGTADKGLIGVATEAAAEIE